MASLTALPFYGPRVYCHFLYHPLLSPKSKRVNLNTDARSVAGAGFTLRDRPKSEP
jgi:hypothetical protein